MTCAVCNGKSVSQVFSEYDREQDRDLCMKHRKQLAVMVMKS